MNVVVLEGAVRETPLTHVFPSGQEVLSFELVVRTDGEPSSRVPVMVLDTAVQLEPDDRVVVVGQVRKRFFRSGAGTQSRTEVVASRIVPTRRRVQARRAIEGAVQQLEADVERDL
jgi:hypothetical protein